MTSPYTPGPRPGPPPSPAQFMPRPPQQQPQQPVQQQPLQRQADGSTGHPAVDAVLQSLANAAQLPPAEQIAEYEAAHQTLQETLASIDR